MASKALGLVGETGQWSVEEVLKDEAKLGEVVKVPSIYPCTDCRTRKTNLVS